MQAFYAEVLTRRDLRQQGKPPGPFKAIDDAREHALARLRELERLVNAELVGP